MVSEEVISESTEVLSDKLSFKIPNTASYIKTRRSVNLPCVGSDIYIFLTSQRRITQNLVKNRKNSKKKKKYFQGLAPHTNAT